MYPLRIVSNWCCVLSSWLLHWYLSVSIDLFFFNAICTIYWRVNKWDWSIKGKCFVWFWYVSKNICRQVVLLVNIQYSTRIHIPKWHLSGNHFCLCAVQHKLHRWFKLNFVFKYYIQASKKMWWWCLPFVRKAVLLQNLLKQLKKNQNAEAKN